MVHWLLVIQGHDCAGNSSQQAGGVFHLCSKNHRLHSKMSSALLQPNNYTANSSSENINTWLTEGAKSNMIFDSKYESQRAWPSDTGIFIKGLENRSNLATLKVKVIKPCLKRYIQFLCQTLTTSKRTMSFLWRKWHGCFAKIYFIFTCTFHSEKIFAFMIFFFFLQLLLSWLLETHLLFCANNNFKYVTALVNLKMSYVLYSSTITQWLNWNT